MALIDVSLLGLATASVAGAISFLSPCVLPLVPGYLYYIAGGTGGTVGDGGGRQLRVLGLALFFVLGFTTVFVLLGLSAMALGGFLQRYQFEANLIGGALIVVFGLTMTGLLRLPALMGDRRTVLRQRGHGLEAHAARWRDTQRGSRDGDGQRRHSDDDWPPAGDRDLDAHDISDTRQHWVTRTSAHAASWLPQHDPLRPAQGRPLQLGRHIRLKPFCDH